MKFVSDSGLSPEPGRALDFGCGVGRLTQALAEYFSEVVGLDISAPMVERAREYNRHGDRCTYRVNLVDDLSQLDSASFDFVYSDKVLQHMHPSISSRYIGEFFRILKPGGVALFQIPSGRLYQPGSLGEKWYNISKGPLRSAWKRIRGMAPVEMHHIHESRVHNIISEEKGELIAQRQYGSVRRSRVGHQYCCIRLSS
jgi:ubiquinone/menaquinone biosynthesis C-methylase UbiE